MWSPPQAIHNGGINVGYLDGHAKFKGEPWAYDGMTCNPCNAAAGAMWYDLIAWH